MKRRLLAVAVGATLSLPMIASAAPTLYGRVDASLDWVKNDVPSNDKSVFQVDSNASRLGVKGDEKLTGDLSAIYMMEWEVDTDGDGGDWGMRNRYAGLKSQSLGTLRLGKFDSALKNAEGWVDQFNDHNETDMQVIIVGQNRPNNVLGYESPKFANAITGRADFIQGEKTNGPGSLGDAVSVSLTYDQNGLYLAAAIDADDEGVVYAGNTGVQVIRLVGGYTMGALQIGGLLQNVDADGISDFNQLLVSAAYTMGDNTFKAQFGMDDKDNDEATMLTVGLDHKLSSNTKVYALATMAERDTSPAAAQILDKTALSTGVQIKF